MAPIRKKLTNVKLHQTENIKLFPILFALTLLAIIKTEYLGNNPLRSMKFKLCHYRNNNPICCTNKPILVTKTRSASECGNICQSRNVQDSNRSAFNNSKKFAYGFSFRQTGVNPLFSNLSYIKNKSFEYTLSENNQTFSVPLMPSVVYPFSDFTCCTGFNYRKDSNLCEMFGLDFEFNVTKNVNESCRYYQVN